jgi:hypothetical protein
MVVRGGARRFGAAALVDRDVHQHAARPHAPQHVAANQPGRLGPRHQHRADEQIHRRQQLQQVRFARVKRVGRVQRDVQEPHPLQVHLQDGHIRPHALAMRAALMPEEPPPSTTTLPGNTPGTPPSNTPLPPLCLARK